MKLRSHSPFAVTLFVLLLTTLIIGFSTVQAEGFYWRFSPPLPSVTCTDQASVFKIGITSPFTITYNLPTPPAAITSAYQNINGGGWSFEGADPSPVHSGTGTLTPGQGGAVPVAGFPANVAIRLDTSINGTVIYRSILTLSCTGVGAGTASISNGAVTGGGSAISDGRINPENYAPVALYCDGSVLTAYKIDSTGGTFDWSFDLSKASADSPLISQLGIALSKTSDGRFSVLAPQSDGKQYLFVFDNCPSPGTTEVYISDPVTGQFVRTE